MEAAIKILEDEFQDIEALKVEVSPMKSVKDGSSLGDEVKKSGAQLDMDIRTILSICTLIEPPFIITFFQFKLLPQKSGCWAVLRTRSRRPRWRASSANFVGCPSSLFDCLQTVLPVPGAAR